jgi:hypothetical protein
VSTATVLSFPTPLEGMSTPDLEFELLGLAGHVAAAECRFLQLLAEFDARGGWAGDGIRSCAHWLSWRAGMSLRTATEHLRVAPRPAQPARHQRRVRRREAVLLRGPGHHPRHRHGHRHPHPDRRRHRRRHLAAAAHPVADAETAERVLLDVALCGTASHVETVVRAVRRRHIPPADVAARRSLTWQWDDDGSLILRARLTPDDGAAGGSSCAPTAPPSRRRSR